MICICNCELRVVSFVGKRFTFHFVNFFPRCLFTFRAIFCAFFSSADAVAGKLKHISVAALAATFVPLCFYKSTLLPITDMNTHKQTNPHTSFFLHVALPFNVSPSDDGCPFRITEIVLRSFVYTQ